MTADQAPLADDPLAIAVAATERRALDALQQGDTEAARGLFQNLLSLQPANVLALVALAEIALAAGDAAEAERLARTAADRHPAEPRGHRILGIALLRQGRAKRALRALDKAIALNPADADAAYNRALALQATGDIKAAMAQLEGVIALNPGHGGAHNDLGCLLIAGRELSRALPHLQKAAAQPGAGADVRCNLANLHAMLGERDAARAGYTQALDAAPDYLPALKGLAMLERQAGRLDAGRLAAEKALALGPGDADARNLLGTVVRELGLYDEAEEHFSEAVALKPGYAPAQVNLSLLHLLMGDWRAGFAGYQARFNDPSYASPWGRIQLPAWDGGALNGRTLLLLSEQGFGDTLQFCRFIAPAAAKGGRVLVAVQPELRSLLGTLDAPVEFVAPQVQLPPVDVVAPLLSLPYLLGIEHPDAIDGRPYLKASAPSDAMAKALDGAGLKVGLCWRGSARHKEDAKRSLDPALLRALLACPGVSFFSLDFNADARAPEGVRDCRPLVRDFADSAALVSALDLVISVDTAAVHLAGALGRPCWALVPFVPDWRWGLSGETTPWYASVRLIRQPELHAWPDAVAEAARRLKALAEKQP